MAKYVEYSIGLNSTKFTNELNKLENKLNAFEQRLAGVGKNFGSNFGSTIKTGSIAAGVAFGTAAYNIISRAAGSVLNLGKEIMKGGLELSRTRADINLLAGKDKSGALMGPALFEDLKKYMLESMFGSEIFEQAGKMLKFGFSSSEIMPMMKSMADITGGDTQRLTQLTHALAEIKAGKFNKQEVNQLITAGLPLQEQAKLMKMSTGEFLQAIHDHRVNNDVFLDRFKSMTLDPKSMFFGRQEELMKTPFGRVQALQENIKYFKDSLGEQIAASDGFNRFLLTIKRLSEKGNEFMPKLVQFGEKIFILFEKIALKFEAFVNAGGLDTVIAVLNTIVDNFQEIVGAFIVYKTTASIISFAKNIQILSEAIVVAGPAIAAIAGFGAAITGVVLVLEDIYDSLSAWYRKITGTQRIDEKEGYAGAMGERSATVTALENFFSEGNAKFRQRTLGTSREVLDYVLNQGISQAVRESDSKGLSKTEKDKKIDYVVSVFNSLFGLAASNLDAKTGKPKVKPGEKSKGGVAGDEDFKISTDVSKVTGLNPVNINIDIQDMIRSVTFNTTSLEESTDEIKNAMIQALTEALNVAEGYMSQNMGQR